MEYREVIHDILKGLKRLEDYNGVDAEEYESMLKSAINYLKYILVLDGHYHILGLTTNIETIGYTHDVAYRGAPGTNNIEFSNVLNHLKSPTSSSGGSIRSILEVLSNPSNPLRIKSEYYSITGRLVVILRSVIKARDDAERKLKEFVCSCILYDLNFYRGKISDDMEDTQMLADIVESQTVEREENSVFSISEPVDIYHPLELESNNGTFLTIYRLLLPVLIVRPRVSVWKVASSIVEVFKRDQKITYFESTEEEVDIASLLPTMHKELNQKYLEEIVEKPACDSEKDEILDPMSVYPSLVQVVNELQDFSKNVNPNFPRLFRHYLKFMDMNLSSTRKQDYDFIEEVPEVVHSILKSDSAVDLKGVLERFIYLQSLLLCDNPSGLMTLLMRASWFDFEKLQRLKEYAFKIWRGRLKKLDEVENRFSKWDTRPQILSKWRLITEWVKLQEAATVSHYEEKLQLIMIWKLKVTLKKMKENNARARQANLRRYFKWWTNQLSMVRTDQALAVRHYENTLLQKCTSVWNKKEKNRKQTIAKLNEDCEAFNEVRRQWLLRRTFTNWCGKLSSQRGTLDLFSKLQKFKEIRNEFTVEIWFQKWRQSTEMIFKVEQLKRKHNRMVVHIVFDKWRSQLHLDERAQHIIHDRNIATKQGLFQKWKMDAMQKQDLRSFWNGKLIHRYFKKWKMITLANLFAASWETQALKDTLKHWKLQTIEKYCRDIKDKDFVVSTYDKWEEKYKVAAIQNEKAAAFNSRRLRKLCYKQWKSSLYGVEDLQFMANIVVQKKFFTRWRNCHRKWTKGYENVRFGNEHTIKRVMSIWKYKYDFVLEKRLSSRIPLLTDYSNLLLKVRYFTKWREQNLYQLELQSINLEYTPSFRTYVYHWLSRLDEVRGLNERIAIYEKGLIDRTFSLWRFRLEQLDSINEKAEDQLAQRNFAILRQSTQDWIYKLNKNVKRNYQLLETFQERTDKRLVRNVIHLWLQKHRDKVEEEELANETYVSSSSPLASRTHQQRQQRESNGIPTLQRHFSPNKISTPRPKVPSPSKLQETSQRMRYQQVSQLRERFGRAKLSPRYNKSISPVKLNYDVDLSPPKDEIGPQLKNEYQSPQSSNSSSPTEIKSQLDVADSSLISTAKRMGRIRPIAFPTGEDVVDVRLSPASKVKRESRILI